MLIRLVEVGIVLIEAVLALRLLLPFMRIPSSLEGVVPTLVTLSDLLIAPFQVFFTPFRLDQLSAVPGGDMGYTRYLDQVDTTVLVAMIGWAIIGSILLFLMGALGRIR
ncbi:MAG: hypothetical protein ABWZ82_11820 [Candidatus Limnocylindrales bacterium]